MAEAFFLRAACSRQAGAPVLACARPDAPRVLAQATQQQRVPERDGDALTTCAPDRAAARRRVEPRARPAPPRPPRRVSVIHPPNPARVSSDPARSALFPE